MENTSEKLYNILSTKFNNTDIKTLTSTGKETTDMEDIEMFSFDMLVDNKNYGPVVILMSADDNLEVYYGDNTSKSLDRIAKKKWENLIEHLSTFARSNRMGFSLKHTTDLKYDLSNIANITESFKNIFESYYGTRKTSYSKQGKAKIIIKHTRALGEDEKRFRNISQLFIENADGERFKLPFKKLAGARAMARHVTEGGNPYDLFGVHICEMVKDINTLGGFVRRSKMFESDEETSGLVETGRTHYASLRKGLNQIAGKRGYHTFKESWKPEEITSLDEDTDAIRKLFTERSVNTNVENALPLLARLQKMAESQASDEDEDKAEADEIRHYLYVPQGDDVDIDDLDESAADEDEWASAMGHDQDDPDEMIGSPDDELDEAQEFENWADDVTEGTWSEPKTSESKSLLQSFFAEEQPLGIDAMNVTGELYDILGNDELFNNLGELAEHDPEADARKIVADYLTTHYPEIAQQLGLQGEYDNPAARDFPREGLENELDADNDSQLNASINKELDKHVRVKESDIKWPQEVKGKHPDEDDWAADEDDEENDPHPYNTPHGIDTSIKNESEQYTQTGDNMNKLFTEYVAEAEAEETKKPWEKEEDEVTEDAVEEACDKDEDLDENTVEVAEAHDGPIVTMESDDLSSLMQRTNHLLKK